MKKSTLLLLTILLVAFNSCKKDDEIDPINDNNGLAENTIQITDSDWQNNIINVDTTTYTFMFKKNVLDNYSISQGDIILGTEDGGYLRKVKNMTTVGDEITIETEFAAITEAFEELHEQTTVSIAPNVESQEFWLEDGVEMNSLKSTSANLMNFSINTVLYDLDGNFSTTTDQVRISGSYNLDADFHIDLDIENFEVTKLMLQYDINQTKIIDGYLGIGGLEYSKKKKLATIPCGTIPAGPVIIEPVIDVYAGFAIDLSTPLQMKIEQNYNSLTTINYQNGNWNTEKSVTENEVFEEPSISGVLNAKLYLKPVLRFRVYRTVSPYIEAELYGAANVELESDFLKWKTSLGFDMNAGVSMMIWNHTLFNFNTNLYNWEHIIAEGQTEYNNEIKNVALSENGATATAISEGTYLGNTQYAYQANDGNSNTGWSSQFDMPAWLNVEFDQVYSIDSIGVWWGSHKHDYSISLSLDGSNWTTVKTGISNNYEGSSPVYELFPINKTNAKYMKIDITSTSAPSSHIFQATVHEIEAYGKLE